MSWLFLLPSLSGAWAASVPVRLPAGEVAADWQKPLALAGLAVGSPGSGAWVELVASDGKWIVRVRDATGAMHEAPVAPPDTAQEREDVALLAASLLEPMGFVPMVTGPAPDPPEPGPPHRVPTPLPTEPAPPSSGVAVRTPTPLPTEPAPPVTEVPPAEPPPPDPTPPVATPPVAAPPEIPPAEVPKAPPERLHLEARVALLTELRLGMSPVVGGWGEVTLAPPGPFRVGLAAGGSTTGVLTGASVPATLTSAGGAVWLGYSPQEGFPLGLAAGGGVAFRWFSQDDAVLRQVTTPVLGARTEVGLHASDWLVVSPGLAFEADLREIDVVQRGHGPVGLADWCARVYVAVRPRLQKRAPS